MFWRSACALLYWFCLTLTFRLLSLYFPVTATLSFLPNLRVVNKTLKIHWAPPESYESEPYPKVRLSPSTLSPPTEAYPQILVLQARLRATKEDDGQRSVRPRGAAESPAGPAPLASLPGGLPGWPPDIRTSSSACCRSPSRSSSRSSPSHSRQSTPTWAVHFMSWCRKPFDLG